MAANTIYQNPYIQFQRYPQGAAGTTTAPNPAATNYDTGIPSPYTPAQHGGDYTVPAGYDATVPSGIVNQTPTGQTANYPEVDYSTLPGSAPTQKTQNTSALPSVLPGWDAAKWGNAEHTTPKYQVGRILAKYSASPQALQQALPEIQALYPGTTIVGKDTLNIPGVGLVDVGGNFSTGQNMNWWWGAEGAGGGADGTGAAGASAGGAAGLAGSGAGSGYGYSSSNSMGGGAFGDSIRSKILGLIGQDTADITKDPNYISAMNAYGTQQQRATERERNAIAERMAAEGTGNSGAMDQQLLAAEQTRWENEASFAGNLAIRELESQKAEIMQALQMGAGLLSQQEQLALTEKLGLINASLEQQSLTNQNNQFNSSLGWQMAQWPSQQNYLAWLMTQ